MVEQGDIDMIAFPGDERFVVKFLSKRELSIVELFEGQKLCLCLMVKNRDTNIEIVSSYIHTFSEERAYSFQFSIPGLSPDP